MNSAVSVRHSYLKWSFKMYRYRGMYSYVELYRQDDVAPIKTTEKFFIGDPANLFMTSARKRSEAKKLFEMQLAVAPIVTD